MGLPQRVHITRREDRAVLETQAFSIRDTDYQPVGRIADEVAGQFFPDRSAAGGSADRLVPGAHASPDRLPLDLAEEGKGLEISVHSASLCGGNDLLH
jgi:hypothetical protein